MRVRLLATISGTRDGVEWPARGGFVDLPESEAADLIRSGLAAADGSEVVETAAIEPHEKAVVPPAKRRVPRG